MTMNFLEIAKKVVEKAIEIDNKISKFEQRVLGTEELPCLIVDRKVEEVIDRGSNIVKVNTVLVVEKVRDRVEKMAAREKIEKVASEVRPVIHRVNSYCWYMMMVVLSLVDGINIPSVNFGSIKRSVVINKRKAVRFVKDLFKSIVNKIKSIRVSSR
jgi:magnesium-transporting ATPase (P-type)